MLILLIVTGFVLSARLGLGIFLQMRPEKYHLLLMIGGYLLIGFCLGHLSESMSSQEWILWFFDEDRLMFFQMAELFLSFLMVFKALSFSSGGTQNFVSLQTLFLLLPSPVVCFWMIFSVGILQTEFVAALGPELGLVLSGAFILIALLTRWFGRLAILLPDATLSGFIFSNILVAALVILLPTTMNLRPIETGGFNFPGQTTLLMLGSGLMIIAVGFVLPHIGRIFSKRSQT